MVFATNKAFDTSISLHLISQISNADISLYLYKDLIPLFNSNKPFIRRKVCIVCTRLFRHNEGIIEELLPLLCDRLKDDSVGVQISCVTSIFELTRLISPKLFLVAMPKLFALMTETKNNWLLIKLIKIFSEFIIVEPRLYKKM